MNKHLLTLALLLTASLMACAVATDAALAYSASQQRAITFISNHVDVAVRVADAASAAATANGNANGKHEVKAKPAKPVKAKAKGERKRDPAKLDQWGFRKDSIKAKAAAIYAKGKGATLQEVKEVVGTIQFNLLKELEEQGHTVDRTDVKTDKGRVVTRYKLRPKE